MRVATWNLERGGRTLAAGALQSGVMDAIHADVVVLTEPPSSYGGSARVVTSPRERRGGRRGLESWVAIGGASIEPVDLEIPFERMAAAARLVTAERSVVLYGSVLPWNAFLSQAPGLARQERIRPPRSSASLGNKSRTSKRCVAASRRTSSSGRETSIRQ